MTIEWEEFLDPYIQAVGELKIKLRGIRKQYRKQNKHSPIEFVTGRVKPIESIKEKMARRGITYATLENDLQDIAGRLATILWNMTYRISRVCGLWCSSSMMFRKLLRFYANAMI